MSYRLPQFLIIGAMKAGTTSIYTSLRRHPEINMATIKEPNFFVAEKQLKGTWHLGLDWYEAIFPLRPGVRGEASTSYTKYPGHPGVAERIYRILPDARLLYLIRNPIDRAISHYLHNIVAERERRDVKEALLTDDQSHYVMTGCYYMQLEQYLKFFPIDQVMVVIAEDMWANQAEVMAKICSYIGVRQFSVRNMLLHDHKHRSYSKINAYVQRGLSCKPVIQRSFEKVIAAASHLEMNAASIGETIGFRVEQRRKLAQSFHSDVAALRKLLSLSLVEWGADFG